MLCNSSWTKNHIDTVASNNKAKSKICYPSCNVNEFMSQATDKPQSVIISYAQFRPEKRQMMQIEALEKVLNRTPKINAKLIMMGNAKDKSSLDIVSNLKQKISEKGLNDQIEIKLSLPMDEVKQVMKSASIAIHTMEDEHFGIGIVEMLSAGLVVIAHNSAGPKFDILVNRNNPQEKFGFLANNCDDYADIMYDQLTKL